MISFFVKFRDPISVMVCPKKLKNKVSLTRRLILSRSQLFKDFNQNQNTHMKYLIKILSESVSVL